jgi:hypothetical protein
MPTGSVVVLVRDNPPQVEVVAIGVSPRAEGTHTDQEEPRPEELTNGDTSAPLPLGVVLGFG